MTIDDLNSEEIMSKLSDLFEYKGVLGTGAFGVVVSAIDKETNKECAVKVNFNLYYLIYLDL